MGDNVISIHNDPPFHRNTGLGPFRFEEWKRGTYILLLKNDHFFGHGKSIGGRNLGPYIDRVMFKIYDNLGAATMALKKGDIDLLWKGLSHDLMENLIQDPNIKLLMTLDSGYRYLGFNLRRDPMSDPAFRRALAYLIDKDSVIKRNLHDHGERLDSVVPPWNTVYFNPDTPAYGKGMDRVRRTQEAYRILTASGYRWKTPPLDAQGSIQKAQGLIMPDGKKMRPLTLLTPSADYD